MALIPPFYLDCVVAVGFDDGKGNRHYGATGFLYGNFISREGDKRSYQIFLVTNKHVFEGKSVVWLRFNPESDEQALEVDLKLFDSASKPIWIGHSDPDIDIAVVRINAEFLKDNKIRYQYFRSDMHVADKKYASVNGIGEGDGVYVLGFPMGLVGEKRNYVIVRQGIVARSRDVLTGNSKDFLIDTTIFPGNSGGPVVTKPEFVSIQGTKPIKASYLFGIVKSYLTYQDIAISNQTKKPRVIFEENSGLAAVIPIDYLIEIVGIVTDQLKQQKEEAPVETTQDDPVQKPA